jgi:hypothetical protein
MQREMIGFAAQDSWRWKSSARPRRLTARRTADPGPAQRLPRPDWETRSEAVELRIPKLRKGCSFPGLLEPRRMAEKVAHGRSTGATRWRTPARAAAAWSPPSSLPRLLRTMRPRPAPGARNKPVQRKPTAQPGAQRAAATPRYNRKI